MIVEHKQRITKHCTVNICDDNTKRRLDELMQRERREELIMINNYSYLVSEDLARGIKDATRFSAIAVNYARQLKSAVDSHDPGVENRGDDFLDTYAYVMLVAEARKSVPDINVFREMYRLLDELADRSSTGQVEDKYDALHLRLVQSHLAAARQLAAE